MYATHTHIVHSYMQTHASFDLIDSLGFFKWSLLPRAPRKSHEEVLMGLAVLSVYNFVGSNMQAVIEFPTKFLS